MKKIILVLTYFFLISGYNFAQGLNNNYLIDNEDIKNLYQMQGINVFKFPFHLAQGEYISLSYHIYEYGVEKEKCNLIEDFQIEEEIEFNHHIAYKDTTVFHRLYFVNQGDSSLNIRIVVPNISINKTVDISKVALWDFTASLNIKEDLLQKRDVLSFYGLYPDSKKYHETEGILSCATGFSPSQLIEKYDFVLIFFAEKITKQRSKTILEEIREIRINN